MKKITCEIPEEEFNILQLLALEQDISMTDALRRALRLARWVRTIPPKKLYIVDTQAFTKQEVKIL